MDAPRVGFVEWCDPAAMRAERCWLDGVMRNPPLNERRAKRREELIQDVSSELKYLVDGTDSLYRDSEVNADQREGYK